MNTDQDPMRDVVTLQAAQRRRRARLLSIVGPAVLGLIVIAAYFAQRFQPAPAGRLGSSDEVLVLVGAALFFASAVATLVVYLQTGFHGVFRAPPSLSSVYEESILDIAQRVEQVRDEGRKEDAKVAQKLVQAEATLQTLREQSAIRLQPDEREEFLALLQSRLNTEAAATILDNLKKQWTHDLDRESQTRIVATTLNEVRQRLSLELSAITRRADLNLAIGVLTTAVGLAVLGFVVFSATTSTAPSDPWLFAVQYIPKLLLVLFIELFAYFFLRLYKITINETKYFQNELTNIESKALALLVALHRPADFGAAAVVSALAATERNFLLKQGESTVDIEALKVENEHQRGAIAQLRAFFAKGGPEPK